MLINIIAVIAGFMLGCVGYREALKTELRECRTEEDLLKVLARMKIIKRKRG